ncbi:hypothetical protein [Streptococcus penaeicida]|uniref:hypothetical protein n=1 Tax=Streptococcus penaeicida TaxID=1765960 RepID=UPI00101ADEA5|nr:hypothetical protein [Streptococcus penaeicida]
MSQLVGLHLKGEKIMNDNKILNSNNYIQLIVENKKGKKIAEITTDNVITANGYIVKLIPANN